MHLKCFESWSTSYLASFRCATQAPWGCTWAWEFSWALCQVCMYLNRVLHDVVQGYGPKMQVFRCQGKMDASLPHFHCLSAVNREDVAECWGHDCPCPTANQGWPRHSIVLDSLQQSRKLTRDTVQEHSQPVDLGQCRQPACHVLLPPLQTPPTTTKGKTCVLFATDLTCVSY